MIHIGTTRTNGVPQRMGFIQNILLECLLLWDNESILEIYGSFCILMKAFDLRVLFYHSSPYVCCTFILLRGQ
jgi:hypothetical protein